MNSTKVFFLLSTYLILISTSQAQFAGTIVYEITHQPTATSHTITLDQEEENATPLLDSVHYSVSSTTYKSIGYSKGNVVEEYIYDPVAKKILFSLDNRPYYLYIQSDLPSFKSPLHIQKKIKNTQTILGYNTYQVIDKDTDEIHYFSPAIQLDSKSYPNHHFMQWNQLLKKLDGHLPLQTITYSGDYTITKTAIRILPTPQDELDFSYDLGKTQVSAYQNLDEMPAYPSTNDDAFLCYQAIVDEIKDKLIIGKDYDILLRFVVLPDYSIRHIHVVESKYDYLHDAAIKFLETCPLGFQPATINGELVPTEYYYPVQF